MHNEVYWAKAVLVRGAKRRRRHPTSDLCLIPSSSTLPGKAAALCPSDQDNHGHVYRSFSIIGPSLWNRLPPSARASLLSSNLSTSLSLLKTCLFLGAN